jgi:hypothetical protein
MKDYNKIYSQEEIRNINILIRCLRKELKENKDKFSINQMAEALQNLKRNYYIFQNKRIY